MIKNPLISIIIPTFNSRYYLGRCLDSVFNQSIKNFEIIVVDDQSTDNTVELLGRYHRCYPNMKIIELGTKALAGGARNMGLTIAKGKYISFVDSDDWLDTNFYYHLAHSIENGNTDMAICGVKREYDNAKNSKIRYRYDRSNIISGKYALSLMSRMLDQDIAISAIVCNKLFKADFIVKHKLNFFENILNEDDIFMFNSLLEAETVSITNKTNYHLYQRRNSISREFTKKHIDDLFFAFYEIRKILIQKNCYEEMKHIYYAFFEKCFSYVIESMRNSVQNEETINSFFKYAFSISKDAISIDEFIDYCGHRRIMNFFE